MVARNPHAPSLLGAFLQKGVLVPSVLKIGIVGAGVFGSYHAAKIANCDNGVLAGIFDINRERAVSLAEKHGATAYETYQALLTDMDAVVIAAPASDHFMLAEAALKAGRHCFVEKPLALTFASAESLATLASNNNLVLQVGHQERYVCEAVGLLAREISPLRIECVRRVPYSGRCNDVSVAFDLMVHDLDIVRQLTKADASSIHADGDPDELSAELILDNGTLAVLQAARKSKTSERTMTLIYEDGVIEFDFVRRTLLNTTPAQLNREFNDEDTPLAMLDPLAYGAQLFVDAIRFGKAALISGRDGSVTVSWAQKIEKAANIGAAQPHVTRLRA